MSTVSETWLDGLLLSSVCTFDMANPQAGIFFQWSEESQYCESIDWYYKHSIPLWFVWSNKEEEAISKNPSLSYLRLPNELIQQALNMLFSVPDIPLTGLMLETGCHRSMGFELIVPVWEKRRECGHLRKWHHGWSSSATSNEMRMCRCCPNRSTNGPHLVWMRAQGGLGSGVRGNELSIQDKEVGTRSLS